MADESTQELTEPAERSGGMPFGPGFFLRQLRVFAREWCPSPSEGLPSVAVHLATGEVLDLCHVIGLAPTFVALAIHDDSVRAASGLATMRTELVPYGIITRVTIRPRRDDVGARVGFDAGREPRAVLEAVSPEDALRAVSRAPPASARSGAPPAADDG